MLKAIEYLIAFCGWIRIVASPFLIASAVGAGIYLSAPGRFTLAVGITAGVAGILIGVLWATRVWKKTGTTAFFSRLDATPELNKQEDGSEK